MLINCDVAEGIENEPAIFPYIDWANIACAAHAGSDAIMHNTMLLAKEHNVQVGLHPSYPDKANFGRVVMPLTDKQLAQTLTAQIEKGINIAAQTNVAIKHIKAHGALYNQLSNDERLAHLYLDIVASFNKDWIIVGLSESMFLKIALQKGFTIANEVFADRHYTKEKTLVARTEQNALITSENKMLQQVEQFLKKENILSIDGTEIAINADTICLHGDGANAVNFAKAMHKLITHEK